MNKKILTKKGLAEIKQKLNKLLNEERPKVIEELKEARAQGDLSENADYDSARDKQAHIEAKIKEFQIILDNYEIIDDKKDGLQNDVVAIGDDVKIKNMKNNKEFHYSIVGSIEADPFENKISNESPLAKAILAKKVGETTYVYPDDSNESYKVKIIDIKKNN